MHSSYGLWEISKVWVVGSTVCSLRSSLSGLPLESWLHLTLTPAPVGKLRLLKVFSSISWSPQLHHPVLCLHKAHVHGPPRCKIQLQWADRHALSFQDETFLGKSAVPPEAIPLFVTAVVQPCHQASCPKTCPLSTPRACHLETQHICLPHVLQESSTGASWQGSTAVGPPLWQALVQDGDVLPQLWPHPWHGISLPLNVQHAEKWQQKLWCHRIEML